MFNWSPGAIKATVGVGGLGMMLLLADGLGLEFGPAFTISLGPAFVLMFTVLDFLPPRVTRAAQWTAVVWYFAAALVALAVGAVHKGVEPIDLLFAGFIAVGAVPCVIVTRRLRQHDRGELAIAAPPR